MERKTELEDIIATHENEDIIATHENEDIIATHEKYTSVMNKREFKKFITEVMIRIYN